MNLIKPTALFITGLVVGVMVGRRKKMPEEFTVCYQNDHSTSVMGNSKHALVTTATPDKFKFEMVQRVK